MLSVPHLRHSRPFSELLNFKLNIDATTIDRTILHVYLRGKEWIKRHNPHLLWSRKRRTQDGRPLERQEIVINVHRALRRANARTMNYTHTIKLTESHHQIPAGLGQWVEIELKQLAEYWINNPESTLSIIVRGQESWMKPFIVTTSNIATNNSPAIGISDTKKNTETYVCRAF